MKQPNPKDNPWRAVAMTSAIGVNLAICIGAGYWLGEWLHQTLGGQMWILGGFLLGLAAAVGSIYLLIKQYGGL